VAAKDVRTKGTGLLSWTRFIDERYGAGTMNKILADAPPELRGIYPNILPSGWYPIEFGGFVYEGLVRLKVGGDRREQAKVFDEIGRRVAEDNLNTVYKFILSMLSPDRVLGMTPKLWTTYFQGIDIKVTPGTDKSGTVVVEGLAPFTYIAPVACGWLTLAYELCGAKIATVTEDNWSAGRAASNKLVFHHRWA